MKEVKKVKRNNLTLEEREKISILYAKYYSIRQIAREVGRSAATVSREINREVACFFKGNYLGAQTHKKLSKNG